MVAFRRHRFESLSNFLFMGAFPLLGVLFMFWIFGESIPNLGLTVDVIGLGAMALGFIPLVAYRRSAYLRQKPTLGRSLAAPEPALDAETIVG